MGWFNCLGVGNDSKKQILNVVGQSHTSNFTKENYKQSISNGKLMPITSKHLQASSWRKIFMNDSMMCDISCFSYDHKKSRQMVWFYMPKL
ncbi:hypothetical protein ES332_D06G222100v1 [Gossypium tomentosum]|uniref:Uncharacterized protein n=1 Tax=Gossypium tomentosum TaxID=34277 RepID=A0A5D2KP90_GOSTO|nr:hypothetical protein ES332_D06G222100v1 [Gossypium tomentosum]